MQLLDLLSQVDINIIKIKQHYIVKALYFEQLEVLLVGSN